MNDGSRMALVSRGAADNARLFWPQKDPAREAAGSAPVRFGESSDRAALLKATAEARTALEDAVVAAAVAAQRARALTVALEHALTVLATPEGDSTKRPASRNGQEPPTSPLSPREQEVLALIAEGRSNKAIAEALYVSPNTIKTHVASLLNKLHASSRVQLAAIATRRLAS